MSARKNVILGGFLLGGLAVLIALSLSLSGGFRWGQRDWTVYFGRDSRVEEGYEVHTSGKKVGLVTHVELIDDPAQMAEGRWVKATISIREDLKLWDGAGVRVVSRGFLGGVGIVLVRGDPGGRELTKGQPLQGTMAPGVFDDISGVVRDNRENIARTTEQISKLVDAVSRGEGTVGKFLVEDDFYKTTQSIATRIDALLADIQSDKSSLGRLFRDDTLYEETLAAARDLRAITASIRNGKGTVGRLFNDETFARELEESARAVRNLAVKLENGEGTLGKLLTDDQIHRDLTAGIQSLRRFTERIEQGQGTIARLLDDDEVYENLRVLTATLRTITEDVKAGRGALGLMLRDETLYREAIATLQAFREGGEIARENAPLSALTSFTSLFFNVLN